MTIRDAFKLTVIDGILFEYVAKRTFESLSESCLVTVCLMGIQVMLTCSDLRSVMRT